MTDGKAEALGQLNYQEFLEPVTVEDLIQALRNFPSSYRVCVKGCNGIGVYDITQIVPDNRGFIEIYTFNSSEHAKTGPDNPFEEE